MVAARDIISRGGPRIPARRRIAMKFVSRTSYQTTQWRRGIHVPRLGTLWIGLIVLCAAIGLSNPTPAQELKFPQIIKIRYEAQDPRVGGHFIIWVEREKIWYGLDSKLYPAAKSVEVTHLTPAPGSITLTTIAVTSVNSTNPDYFHLSGNVRFKISGMAIKSTNAP
jgi:hypothetical protein